MLNETSLGQLYNSLLNMKEDEARPRLFHSVFSVFSDPGHTWFQPMFLVPQQKLCSVLLEKQIENNWLSSMSTSHPSLWN